MIVDPQGAPRSTAAPPMTLSIQDILNIHGYLKSVKEPSGVIKDSIAKVETLIAAFTSTITAQVNPHDQR